MKTLLCTTLRNVNFNLERVRSYQEFQIVEQLTNTYEQEYKSSVRSSGIQIILQIKLTGFATGFGGVQVKLRKESKVVQGS